MKYKEKLGFILVIFSIILLVSLMFLCSYYNINPLLGIGTGFVVMVGLIFAIPNRIMTYDKEEIRKSEMDS